MGPTSEGATTGSAGEQPSTAVALAQRPDPPRRSLRNGERVITEDELTAKHRLVAQYMVYGCDHASLLARIPADAQGQRPRPGVPLTLVEAAMVAGIRRRLARNLHKQPVFQRLIGSLTQDLRASLKPRAIHRIGALIDEPGEGTAADRKVQLEASRTALGDEARGGVTVNVQTNVAQVPGYVIRLPPGVDAQREE